MKRILLILAALIFLSCGGSSSYFQAEVLVGIRMTQTAVALAQPPTQKPPVVPAVTLPPPTPAPPPLDLGAATRILLQTGRCSPAGSGDCQWQHSAVYTCDQNGENLKKVIDNGELIGISPDGQQGLLSLSDPDLPTFTLSLVDLTSFTLVQLAQNFRHTYACNANRCSAIWLTDGKIAYIGEGTPQNNQLNINIYLSDADGTGATPLLAQASGQPPLVLYRSNDPERIYWETGSGAVPSGLFSTLVIGGDLRQETDIIDPAFSPAGNRVAFLKTVDELGYQTAFFISSTDWQNPSQIYAPQVGEYVGQYRWSPNGENLVFQAAVCAATCTAKHYIWNNNTSALQDLPAEIGFVPISPFWSSDGRYVLYNSRDQGSGKPTYSALNTETLTLQPFLEKLVLPEDGLEVEYFYAIP